MHMTAAYFARITKRHRLMDGSDIYINNSYTTPLEAVKQAAQDEYDALVGGKTSTGRYSTGRRCVVISNVDAALERKRAAVARAVNARLRRVVAYNPPLVELDKEKYSLYDRYVVTRCGPTHFGAVMDAFRSHYPGARHDMSSPSSLPSSSGGAHEFGVIISHDDLMPDVYEAIAVTMHATGSYQMTATYALRAAMRACWTYLLVLCALIGVLVAFMCFAPRLGVGAHVDRILYVYIAKFVIWLLPYINSRKG